MKTVFDLKSHAALVTGSSRGIGFAIGEAFRQAGAAVVFHGPRPESRPASVDQQDYLPADLTHPEAAADLIGAAFSRQPGLDALVANAGSFFDRPFLELRLEDWRKTMRLNLEATFVVCQAFARKLAELDRAGSIVIISSTNSFQAEDESVAYDTSKGGLYMMTRSLAVSLARHNIRVNGVAPGLIRTPLTDDNLASRPDVVAHYERKILCQRLGKPEDCAGACAFLVSEASEYVNGHVIIVDGGLTVGQIGRMPESEGSTDA